MMDSGTVAELEKFKIKNEDSEKNVVDNSEKLAFRRQLLMSFGTFLITLGAGSTSGISAILIPQLQHAKGRHKIGTEMVSWIAAISSLALLFGNIISGYSMERLGRRNSLAVVSITFVTGWLIIGCAGDLLYLMLIGRFITGLCQGWLGPLGPVFVAEISSPAYRGVFLASLSLSIAAGVLLSHLFGTFLHWGYASLFCGLFPFIGGIIMFYGPESPCWLASMNRIDDCISSFQWYRGRSLEMKTELEKIIAEQTKKNKTTNKIKSLRLNIQKPEFYKPLYIMAIFFITTQLSGVNVVCAYTTIIMKELIGNSTSKKYTYTAMLCVDVLRCLSLITTCFLLKSSGRRPIAIFSGSCTSASLLILSLYLYLVNSDVIRHISPFISIGLMAFYIVVSNLGIGPLPYNMVGELFATETKGLGSGISVMMTSVAFFATIKTAPTMFEGIGHHGAYLFYGLSTLMGTLFLYFYLPETKDKTLLQIEEHFKYGKKNNTKEDLEKKNITYA